MVSLDGKVSGGLAHKVVGDVGSGSWVVLASSWSDDAGRFGQATRALRLSTRQPSHVKVNADLDYGWHDFLETDLASAKHSHLHVAYLSGKPRYDTCCSSTLHSPYMNTVSQWPAC